jgi:hypothetical protein
MLLQASVVFEPCMCSTTPDISRCAFTLRYIENHLRVLLLLLLLLPGVFTTNKRGYPILSKAHQELLSTAYRHNVQVGCAQSVCNCNAATLDAIWYCSKISGCRSVQVPHKLKNFTFYKRNARSSLKFGPYAVHVACVVT